MSGKIPLPFKIGDSVSNRVIMDTFKCRSLGGIRYSTATNTIVLIANHAFKVYVDQHTHDGKDFFYTGEGQHGDQEMTRGNKRLRDSQGISVHLFEHFADRKSYVYSGSVEVGEPYQETQPDSKGESRRVWIFPLKFIEEVTDNG